MERISSVPKFDGTNFDDWKFLMQNALRDEGCLEVTTTPVGDLILEVGLDAPGDNAGARKRKEEKISALESKENRCRRLLGVGLTDHLELLKDKANAAEMWKSVCERFGRASLASRAVFSKEYAMLKYKPAEEEFSAYCMRFDKVVRGLRNAGGSHSDEDIAFHFLWSLPREYEAQTSAIEANPSNVNLTFIRNKIEEYEMRTGANRKRRVGSGSPTTSFNALNVSGRGRGLNRFFPYSCNNCGYRGHKSGDCTKPGGGAHRGGHHQKSARGGQPHRGNYQSGNQNHNGNNNDNNRGGNSGGYQGGRGQSSNRGGRGFSSRGNHGGRGGFRGGSGRGGSSALITENSESGYDFSCSEDNEVMETIVVKSLLTCDVQVSERALSVYGNSCVAFTLDSGATRHLVKTDVPVSQKQTLPNPVKILVAKTDICMLARSKALVSGYTIVDGVSRKFELEALIVDDLSHNLLSIPCLDSEGYWTSFGDGKCYIEYDNELLAVGILKWNLFVLEVGLCSQPECSMMTEEEKLWHRRLGHLGCDNIKRLCDMVDGVDKLTFQGDRFCEVCIEGKQAKLPFGGTRPKTTRPLERVHSDLCGPISPVAYNGAKYILTIIDDFTHYTVVYGLKSKESEEVAECIKAYVARVSVLFPRGISQFRCDNGTEYLNDIVKQFFQEKGIVFELTIPGTPQLNGVAERLNRTLLEKARCLLFGSRLSKRFWIDALLTAVYLTNRSPTRAIDGGVVPYELWTGRKPNLENLKVFGCVSYVSKNKQQLAGKLDSRVKKCILIGYCDNGYKFWSVTDNKIIVGRNVVFNENLNNFDNFNVVYGGNFHGNVVTQFEDESDDEGENDDMEVGEDQPDGGQPIVPELEEYDEPAAVGEGVRRGTRVRMRPAMYDDYVMLCTVGKFVDDITDENCNNDFLEFAGVSSVQEVENVDNVPADYESISVRKDKVFWLAAVNRELNSLLENATWEVCSLPKGKTPINNKWVFNIKLDADGNIERYKARLVIKGCAQKYGEDYLEVYAPVAKLSTVRIFLCLANKLNLIVHQLDVECAFLNGDLKEEIYMWPPAGLSIEEGKVCKLRKTLYGLKQAPMEWNYKFDECVKALGFTQCQADRCVYIKKSDAGTVYLLLYVDDFLIACADLNLLSEIKGKLMNVFKMRDLGEASYFLGIRIRRTNSGMVLSQDNYVSKIISKLDPDSAKAVQTPMETNPDLAINNDPSIIGRRPYRSAIGSLMYACMSTRPDICAAVNVYSQFQAYATEKHYKGVRRIIKYLKGTVNWGLWFKGLSEIPLTLYADADFANDPDRKSISGFVIEMFGDPVAWGTRKQTCVAKSTTEAEYIALATGVSELLWVRQLVKELGVSIDFSIPVYEDNTGAIAALQKWDVKRLKHVDLKYNFVKDLSHKKIIDVQWIDTKEQKADIMTKGLPYESFSKHRQNIGMCEYRN